MLDHTLLGDISNDDELEATLKSYDEDWYIGKETDIEWAVAVKENRGNLFSVGQNMAQGTYTSRSLTLQDVIVHMGSINSESVIGQWSNLNMELLYMTNDDEERYSIQAQPALLRNLTVQAADPPLGYPIYSSPPMSVPTL
uniref:Pecanex-like protein n=1 Tax=Arion vulgaris TaxID=1028688 RepID=A0A0B6ZWM3_9EUPU